MLLQVHDELVFETDEAELPALARLAAETMEHALPLDVPLTVDLKVGTSWDGMDRLELTADGGYRRAGVAEEAEEPESELALVDA